MSRDGQGQGQGVGAHLASTEDDTDQVHYCCPIACDCDGMPALRVGRGTHERLGVVIEQIAKLPGSQIRSKKGVGLDRGLTAARMTTAKTLRTVQQPASGAGTTGDKESIRARRE